MREAFSQKQEVKLNQEKKENKRENQSKKKTPAKPETLQKLVELGVNITKVFFEEDAQALLAEKNKENVENAPKRSKQDQIRFEAITLAGSLDIPLSDDVGTKAILDSVKTMIEAKKRIVGNDIAKMAEILSYEVSYKAILTEYEIYNNTTSGLGVSSLADYNRYRLGL